MSILHSVLSSHALCQPVLIVSTSVKKYRSGVPFKELTTSLAVYIYVVFLGLKKIAEQGGHRNGYLTLNRRSSNAIIRA